VDQSIRFSPEDLRKIECYAKIEVGLFPGSQLFFSGKIDSVLSNSPYPIHGSIVRLENMLIGRIVSLMNKEEYQTMSCEKTEDEIFLEILYFENTKYEKQIYDNIEEHLAEMNHQSEWFYDTIQGIKDDKFIEKVRQLSLEKDAEIEKRLFTINSKLREKYDLIQKEIELKSDKLPSLDYENIDDLSDKIRLFEKMCRTFIVSSLSVEDNWWKQKIPKDVRTEASMTKERNEKVMNYSKSQSDLINFIDFPDIEKIILANKKYFKSIKHWDQFTTYMKKIHTFRNELFHSRELSVVEKYHLNISISEILQMFQNSRQEHVIDTSGAYTLRYKKPVSENYFPKDFITPENNFKLKKHELLMMNLPELKKHDTQNIFYHITKNPKSLLIWFSNYAKKEKIPLVHFECTSETTAEELVGRRNYTMDSKKDKGIGVELGAFKLANELSEIHGSAIIFLENLGTIAPNIQNLLIRDYLQWGRTDTQLSLFGIKNYHKLNIIGTDKSHLISKRLHDYANFFLDDELK
jgi:hypothetical protein